MEGMIWRTVILSVLAFLVLPISSGLADPAILHHDLNLLLLPEKGSIEGTSTLTIAPGGSAELRLELAPHVRIDFVRLEGRDTDYHWQDGALKVPMPVNMRSRELALAIGYRGWFQDPVPENPVHSEDPTYGVAATIAPRGTFLSSGAGWYPDMPGSRPSFRLRLETPPGTEGVTSGRRVDHGTHNGRTLSTWETDSPLPGLTLAAGPYVIRETKAGGIPVYTYFYQGSQELADNYLKAARGYLELYVGLFGPYPFEKFAIVENFFPTGYGFPSWTLLGSSVVRLPFIVETSLGHEIAHSWWGNGVRNDYRQGNWSEGLTTYVADHLYKQRESSEAGREYRLKLLRDYTSLVSPENDFALRQFTGRRSAADQAVGYGKAAMIFHMVRKRIGDGPFWEGLRAVASSKMGQEATWDDFAAQFGKAAGEDLRGFFHQWVDRPGAPVLNLSEVHADQIGEKWRVTGFLLQEAPPYDLRVPLRLQNGNGSQTTVLAVQGRRTAFHLESAVEPIRLVVDPEVDIFRRLDPAEVPPTVNGIRGSDALTVVEADRLPPGMTSAARLLLGALRQDGADIRMESEISLEDLRDQDVLFIGVPHRAGFLPPIPGELQFAEKGFTLQGVRFNDPDAVLFAALPHPVDTSRTAAIFFSLSADAAGQAATKIPHYGKYSFLAFEGGTNRAKGIWPPAASRVIHDFVREEPAN